MAELMVPLVADEAKVAHVCLLYTAGQDQTAEEVWLYLQLIGSSLCMSLVASPCSFIPFMYLVLSRRVLILACI